MRHIRALSGLYLIILPFFAAACSSAGDADARLAALEQTIRAVEAESESHEAEALDAADHDRLMEIEIRHRDRLRELAKEMEDAGATLDACGFSSCCSTSLEGLADAHDALVADMDAHHAAAAALDAMSGVPGMESDHRAELMQVAGAMQTHHDAMASAGMCCQCEDMHRGR